MYPILLTAICTFLALNHVHAALDPAQMQQRLAAGAPILGTFNNGGTDMSKWMGSFPDDIAIEKMNIPGTHDSCAWNYTGLLPDLVNTQSLPIFSQLDAGIRFLDLRIGINNGAVMIYHGDALLSDTVQLEDVLWGLYHFLDTHPTETIVASIKVDHGDMNDATLQKTLHDQITTAPTSDYWVQGTIPGSLGLARHKVILFRRYTQLPDLSLVGIDVSHDFKDNDADFVINYSGQQSAYIEDLYQINGDNQPPATKIPVKFGAVTTHLDNANGGVNQTQLFVTFASGTGAGVGGVMTPKVLAVGDPANNVAGINSQLSPWLQQRKGNRFGIVLFDFYESEPNLVAAAIGLSVTAAPSTGTSNGTPTKPGSQSTQSSSAPSAVSSIPLGIYLIAALVPSLVLPCL